MLALRFLHQQLYPILLLLAAIIPRKDGLSGNWILTVPAIVYWFSFLLTVAFRPHTVIRGRELFTKSICGFLAVFSGLEVLGQAIFQLISRYALHDPVDFEHYLSWFSFFQYNSFEEGVAILPDLVVFISSTIILWALLAKQLFKEYNEIPKGPPNLKANNLLFITCVFFASICYPSVFTGAYFIVYIISLAMFIAGKTIDDISDIWYPAIYFYTAVYMTGIYLYQAMNLFTNSITDSTWINTLFALFYWKDFKVDEYNSWMNVAEWVILLTLFLLYSYRHHRLEVSRAHNIDPHSQVWEGHSSHKDVPLSFGRSFGVFGYGMMYVGWVLCLALLIVVAILTPSLFGMLYLLAVCLGALVTPPNLRRWHILPIAIILVGTVTVAQYIFNLIPEYLYKGDANTCDAMCHMTSVGLVRWNLFSLNAGLQALTMGALVVYYRFCSIDEVEIPIDKDETVAKSGSYFGLPFTSGSDDGLLISDYSDSLVFGPEVAIQHELSGEIRLKADEEDVKHPSFRTRLNQAWASEQAISCRMATKKLFWYFLRKSYLVSLVGLYFAAMNEYNVLHAGYFFFSFFSLSLLVWPSLHGLPLLYTAI